MSKFQSYSIGFITIGAILIINHIKLLMMMMMIMIVEEMRLVHTVAFKSLSV